MTAKLSKFFLGDVGFSAYIMKETATVGMNLGANYVDFVVSVILELSQDLLTIPQCAIITFASFTGAWASHPCVEKPFNFGVMMPNPLLMLTKHMDDVDNTD